MRADRWLILAAIVLGCGLWTLFAYCHGTAGLSFALPFSASSASLDIKTMGAPVWFGVPLTVIGLIVLLVAIAAAIVAQFRNPHRGVRQDTRVDARRDAREAKPAPTTPPAEVRKSPPGP